MATRVVHNPGAEVHMAVLRARLRRNLAEAIAEDIRRGAPRDTGAMSEHVRVVNDGRQVVIEGGGRPLNRMVPIYVEYGTGPHWIISHGYAAGRRYPWPLRNRRTGEVFGPVVWHPGTPAQPFIRPAAYRRRNPQLLLRGRGVG